MIHQNFRQGTGFLPYLPLCVIQENTVFFLHVLQRPTSCEVEHRVMGCDAELAAVERG